MDSTLLHDDPTGDPSNWQRPEHLSELLGISVRSLRLWASKGKAEKLRAPGGKVYYRLSGNDGQPELPPSGNVASDEHLRLALVELQRDHAERLERLGADLTAARAAAAAADGDRRVAEVLADVATRDAERAAEATEDAARALAQIQAQLTAERQRRRAVELAYSLPWYRFGQRRRLIASAGEGIPFHLEVLLPSSSRYSG